MLHYNTHTNMHLGCRARKTVELNVDAANRFISAAIPELTDEQRAALRAGNQVGNATKDTAST